MLGVLFCGGIALAGCAAETGAGGSGGAVSTSSGGGFGAVGGAGGTTSSGAGGSGVGGTGTAGAGGEGAGSLGGAGGEAPVCVDNSPAESNDTEEIAYPLSGAPITDDDADGGELSGVLAGPDDVDWYTYRGDDTSWGVADPTVSWILEAPGARVCIFLACLSVPTEFPNGCPSGSYPESSGAGRIGCCSTGSLTLDDYNCTGSSDEDAYVYIRIDAPGAPADLCASYRASYHF